MHNIKVRYHIVGKQEELQEIYDLYQTFIQKERPAMEEDEADDWEGNIILALGVDYGTCNLITSTIRIPQAWKANSHISKNSFRRGCSMVL